MRGGTKQDAKEVGRQKQLLTQQEREIAHLKAQLERRQVCTCFNPPFAVSQPQHRADVGQQWHLWLYTHHVPNLGDEQWPGMQSIPGSHCRGWLCCCRCCCCCCVLQAVMTYIVDAALCLYVHGTVSR